MGVGVLRWDAARARRPDLGLGSDGSEVPVCEFLRVRADEGRVSTTGLGGGVRPLGRS